mgnify:CR=1 FL=1
MSESRAYHTIIHWYREQIFFYRPKLNIPFFENMNLYVYDSTMKGNSIVKKEEICYKVHEKNSEECTNSSCRYNINLPECQNCVLIASNKKHTLQDIGDIYGVTRMRICQIEKRAIEKLGDLATKLF